MNQVQMVALLNSIEGLPVYYDHASTDKPLPLLTVHVNQGSNFGADNHVYVQGWDFTVDMYTETKNQELEAKVKKVLNDAGVYWSRSEVYLSDELCYEIEFTFSVLGDETNPIPDPEPDPDPDPEPDPEPGEDGDG